MTAKSMITTLDTVVIRRIPKIHAHVDTIFVLRERNKYDSAIGKLIKLFL
jgi:hypothetical protein